VLAGRTDGGEVKYHGGGGKLLERGGGRTGELVGNLQSKLLREKIIEGRCSTSRGGGIDDSGKVLRGEGRDAKRGGTDTQVNGAQKATAKEPQDGKEQGQGRTTHTCGQKPERAGKGEKK